MSKSTKKHYEKMLGTDQFFQSAAFNQRTFDMYRQWLTAMALNRFKWLNLPPGVSERMLEQTLYYNGVATISEMTAEGEGTGLVYGLQAVTRQMPDAQDNYNSWTSQGVNGFSYDSSSANGVLIWDNRQRLPIAGVVDLYARRLANIDRTLDINMMQQRTPYIVTGPQGKELDIANVLKSIAGGEPAVVGYENLTNLIKVDAIKTGVPCIAQDINTAWTMVWNNALRFLGMGGINEKAERLVTMEAETQNEPAELMALDPLTARREACDAYNEIFAGTLVRAYGELSCVWRQDCESNAYNWRNDPILRSENSAE